MTMSITCGPTVIPIQVAFQGGDTSIAIEVTACPAGRVTLAAVVRRHEDEFVGHVAVQFDYQPSAALPTPCVCPTSMSLFVVVVLSC